MSCKRLRKWNFIYKLSSDDRILSLLIKKAWCTSTFLNHFREANEQLLCVQLLRNRLCCYSFLYRTSLVFLKISQNSQENTCARVSFSKKVLESLFWKRLQRRCWRTPIFIEHLRWLLLELFWKFTIGSHIIF